MKEYRDKNKEMLAEKSKLYRETHTKEKAKYDKIYRDNNKERIKCRKGKHCMCECGNNYTHDHESRHLETKIHQGCMENNTKLLV